MGNGAVAGLVTGEVVETLVFRRGGVGGLLPGEVTVLVELRLDLCDSERETSALRFFCSYSNLCLCNSYSEEK